MKTITEKELEFLFPEAEYEIAGHTFTLRPFTFAETRIVAKKLANVLHLFEGELTFDMMAVIYAEAYDGIRDVVAMSLSIKPELVDKFDQKSAVAAIKAVVEVNKDFFVQEVQPLVVDLAKKAADEPSKSES